MEKYFVVNENHDFYKRCSQYIEKRNDIFNKAYAYMKQFDVEDREVGVSGRSIYVADTKENRDKFGNMLKKDAKRGWLEFKKNSKIAKEWTHEKPYPPSFIFDVLSDCGRYSERMFIFENKLYIGFRLDHDFETPDGYTEIKASQYHATVELINENKLHVDVIN